MLKSILARVRHRITPPAEPIWMNRNPRYARYEIGDWSYGRPNIFEWGNPSESLKIGKFCSLAWDSNILLGGEHLTTAVSTHPFAQLWPQHPRYPAPAPTKGGVTIGNDVWIGHGATILSGVAIGNGAVIGAGAMIARDVPGYAIVVGNPGKIVRMRFDEAAIIKLEGIAWWNWPDAQVAAAILDLAGPIEDFVAKYAR